MCLQKNILLSPCAQVYYNAYSLGRWPFLVKRRHLLWVDLIAYLQWVRDSGRELGVARKAQIEQMIALLNMEAATV